MKNLKAWFRYLTKNKNIGDLSSEILKMDKVVTLNSKTLKEQELFKLFRVGHHWGNIHPKHLYTYTDPSTIGIYYSYMDPSKRNLVLSAKYQPKEIPYPEQKTTIAPKAVGLLSSKEKYLYGYFEIQALLPKDFGSWPSFWLWSQILDRYQEIDILEGYAGKTQKYHGGFLKMFPNVNLASNLHWGSEFNKRHIVGAKQHPLPSPVSNSYNYFGLLWLPNKIEIYYNRYLVRKITDPKILNSFNNPMTVVINNVLDKNYSSSSYNEMLISQITILQNDKKTGN